MGQALGPSGELRRWFGHGPGALRRVSTLFPTNSELRRRSSESSAVVRETGPLTLVFRAHPKQHNDAVVLAQILVRGRTGRHAERP